MANNVLFSISTQMEMDGRQLKALKPNKDGIYEGIPLTVLGMNSRNKVNYDRESVKKCLTDMEQRFAANVSTGDLEGEWGHPLLTGDNVLERLMYIDRTKVSHFFTKIYGKDMGDGLVMVYGDVKPFGPYGQYLKDSFEDPTRNTSFSLRSAAAKTGVVNGITQKKMLSLVTFDAVDGPGFLKASKRFQDLDVAKEGYDLQIDPTNKYDVEISVNKQQFLASTEALQTAGIESICTNQAVLDAFGCDRVRIKDAVFTMDGKSFTDDAGNRVSLFDMCFNH